MLTPPNITGTLGAMIFSFRGEARAARYMAGEVLRGEACLGLNSFGDIAALTFACDIRL